jgi:dolichol-phosphate mannosyltransferase
MQVECVITENSSIDFSPVALAQKTAALPLQKTINLSVVIPVYRAAEILPLLHERLKTTLKAISGLSYEIIFVDDCSPDRAWIVLEQLTELAPETVRAVKLSRNFGQQAAITAGLAHARGEWAVVMDCDLQDPPEAIPSLLAKSKEGFDIVMARRASRESEPVRAILSKSYFKLLSILSGAPVDGRCGAFSLISRPVIDSFLRFTDHNRQYLLIIFWLGFNRGYVEIEHAERAAGQSSYAITKLLRLALQGMFFQSTMLLELIVSIGFVISLAGFIGCIYCVVEYFVLHTVLSGWTSTVTLILLTGGFNLFAAGIVGLYIGQIFEQVKGRPVFVVQKLLDKTKRESE